MHAADTAGPRHSRGKKGKDDDLALDEVTAQEPAHPLHKARQIEAAQYQEARSERNRVVESYYELFHGQKLLLVKLKASGNKHKVYIGRTKNPEVREFVAKLDKEGKLRRT